MFNRIVCIVLKWIKWEILLFFIIIKNKVRNRMKLKKGIFFLICNKGVRGIKISFRGGNWLNKYFLYFNLFSKGNR